jgi:hypothetical protein
MFSVFGIWIFLALFFQMASIFVLFSQAHDWNAVEKNVWNHLKNFLQHQEAKRSVVARFQIFLGTLWNFSIYLWVNQEIITINGKLGPKISRMHTAFFHTSTTTPKKFHTIWRWSYCACTRRMSFSHEVLCTSQREQCLLSICMANFFGITSHIFYNIKKLNGLEISNIREDIHLFMYLWVH